MLPDIHVVEQLIMLDFFFLLARCVSHYTVLLTLRASSVVTSPRKCYYRRSVQAFNASVPAGYSFVQEFLTGYLLC